MPGMKEFATELSDLIFEQKLNDEKVVEQMRISWPNVPEEWLLKQTQYCRAHPEIYRERMH